MDIQIADGLSFDIFRQAEVRSPVIFTTAFDQYAVQAFRVNEVDYLLKSIEPKELRAAFEKIESRREAVPDWRELASFFQKREFRERFFVKSGQHFASISSAEIAWFFSSDGLTQACTRTGKKHFVDQTLDELERELDPKFFYCLSRNCIVALASVSKISLHLNGRLKPAVMPELPENVFVSRDRAGGFKAWLGG